MTLDDDIRSCTSCPAIVRYRTQPVPGEGPLSAVIMFIGEAPGCVEDRVGRPFVGPSGRYFRAALRSASIDPASVFITNSARCHPPGNRAPTRTERLTCSRFLLRRLARMPNLSLIVALGGCAYASVRTNTATSSITAAVGIPQCTRPLAGRTYSLLPTHHPSAVLHARRRGSSQWERQFAHSLSIIASALAASDVAGSITLDDITL